MVTDGFPLVLLILVGDLVKVSTLFLSEGRGALLTRVSLTRPVPLTVIEAETTTVTGAVRDRHN